MPSSPGPRPDREGPIKKWFRKASARTHPIVVLAVLLVPSSVVLGFALLYLGPIGAPLALVAVAVVVAVVLEIRDYADAKGWL